MLLRKPKKERPALLAMPLQKKLECFHEERMTKKEKAATKRHKFQVHDLLHKSGSEDLVIIESRIWTDNLGWRYSIEYIQIVNEDYSMMGGGTSAYWNEDLFEKPKDPKKILTAALIHRVREIKRNEYRIKLLRDEVKSLKFTVELMK